MIGNIFARIRNSKQVPSYLGFTTLLMLIFSRTFSFHSAIFISGFIYHLAFRQLKLVISLLLNKPYSCVALLSCILISFHLTSVHLKEFE